MLADLAAAFALLTRLPTGHLARPPAARETWAYPVVGLVVGAACAAVYAFACHAGLGAPLAATWTLAASILLTGGLHEDGLADVADGMGGGGTRARKLEIMRDSRIGTYGALALLLSLGIRITAIASLSRPLVVAAALVVAATAGRAAMIVLLLALPPARADGMAAGLGRQPTSAAFVGLAIAAVVAVALLPIAATATAILAAAIASVALAVLARAQIGGHTGDVLGAAEQATECVVITVLAAMLPH